MPVALRWFEQVHEDEQFLMQCNVTVVTDNHLAAKGGFLQLTNPDPNHSRNGTKPHENAYGKGGLYVQSPNQQIYVQEISAKEQELETRTTMAASRLRNKCVLAA
jgi:hypothetical protein